MKKISVKNGLFKIVLAGLAVGFGIFFGMDLAAKGRETGIAGVNGSMWPRPAANAEAPRREAVQPAANAEAQRRDAVQAAAAGGPSGSGAAAGERALAGRTGAAASERAPANRAGTAASEHIPADRAGAAVDTAVEPAAVSDSFLNRLSNKLGDVLRRVVRFVLSLIVGGFNWLLS